MRGTRALACLAAVVSLALLVVPATALPHHMHMRAARVMRRGAAGCAPHAAGAPRWLHAPHGALTLRGGAGHEAETVRGVLAIIVAIFAEVTFVRLCGPAAGPQPLGGAHARERARPCGPGPEDARARVGTCRNTAGGAVWEDIQASRAPTCGDTQAGAHIHRLVDVDTLLPLSRRPLVRVHARANAGESA